MTASVPRRRQRPVLSLVLRRRNSLETVSRQ